MPFFRTKTYKVNFIKGLVQFFCPALNKLSATIILLTLSFFSLQPLFAEDVIIDINTVWEAGTYTYDNVFVTNGATLTFNGKVILNANNLAVDFGSSISVMTMRALF